uniref:Uncharacterized protein n=1 Tax=Calidris pygmaea TaxID=425635 RepID=A0A8C3J8N7_9CHAR
QCYRLMAVEQEYCLDPSSQSSCFLQPPPRQPLPRGRTVLFGVQPKFTNVDIRVTLDVTFGAVDLFVASSYDTFAVDVDPATGRHLVRLQTHGGAANGAANRANQGATNEATNGGTNGANRARAVGLVTYVTVGSPPLGAGGALVVRGVRDRVVLTFPHTLHPLKSTRFYLLLLGVGDDGGDGDGDGDDDDPHGGASQGLLFFRQDQAHIDLFVFFSVFFSCFFLFLALCVLLWRLKQGLDRGRERRRHLREMSQLASRPFARVTVCFAPPPPKTPPKTHHPPPPRPPKPPPGPPNPGPLTLEPTEDGVAAVATLLLQLPGGARGPPHRAALASALVTLRLQEFFGAGGGAGGGGGGAPPFRKGGG